MGIGIDHSEEHGWPQSRWEYGVFYGQRRLRCAWSDRRVLAAALDTPPDNRWPYPDGPSDSVAYRVDIGPAPGEQQGTGALASYKEALLVVHYTSAGPTITGVPEVEVAQEWIEPSSEMRQMDNQFLRWTNASGDPVEANDAPRIYRERGTYVLRAYRCVTIPGWVFFRTGRVNLNAFPTYSLYVRFPPETLLGMTPTIQRIITNRGPQMLDITCRYRIDWEGWNMYDRQGKIAKQAIWHELLGEQLHIYEAVPYV